jgi:hypothetical protein
MSELIDLLKALLAIAFRVVTGQWPSWAKDDDLTGGGIKRESGGK